MSNSPETSHFCRANQKPRMRKWDTSCYRRVNHTITWQCENMLCLQNRKYSRGKHVLRSYVKLMAALVTID